MLVTHLRIKDADVFTIYNGLPDLLLRRERVKTGLVITMVARFDVQKDHATLFRALSTLLHLEWELRLSGLGATAPVGQVARPGMRVVFADLVHEPVFRRAVPAC